MSSLDMSSLATQKSGIIIGYFKSQVLSNGGKRLMGKSKNEYCNKGIKLIGTR